MAVVVSLCVSLSVCVVCVCVCVCACVRVWRRELRGGSEKDYAGAHPWIGMTQHNTAKKSRRPVVRAPAYALDVADSGLSDAERTSHPLRQIDPITIEITFCL